MSDSFSYLFLGKAFILQESLVVVTSAPQDSILWYVI